MSLADLHDLELVWPSLRPTDVIVTGTFDRWSSSIHLVKGDIGFSGTVKVPWNQKIAYKFIVDGRWQCRDDQPQEDDGHGNTNNVLQTPEKPLVPIRLSIPVEGDGYGDLEAMVTAVEFFPPAEYATIKGSLPLAVPQITVEGLDQAPSAGSPLSESKLDTAVATEGHVFPALETPAKELSSHNVSTPPENGNGLLSLPSLNGSGEAHEANGMTMPSQIATGESATSPSVSEIANAALEGGAPPLHSQATLDIPDPTTRVDVPLASASAMASEPIAEPSKAGTAAEGQRQQKKWRSFFARIKRIFERNKDK